MYPEVQAEEGPARAMRRTPDGVAVCLIRADEWATLREVRLRALATDPRSFGATLAEESALAEADWQARAAPQPDRATFVAELGGAWAGIVTGKKEDGAVEVLGLWAAPEARGHGVGRALMDAVAEWTRQRGAGRLLLWVSTENAPALRLYEACGYEKVGEPRQGKRDPTRWFWLMERVTPA